MKKIILVLILVAIVFPVVANAQTVNSCSPARDPVTGQLLGSLPRCINQIYLWAMAVAAILAVLGVIAGGYQLMTASGNAQQATEGKERFIAAAVGLGILFSAYIILNTINPDLVDFSNFQLGPTPPPSAPQIETLPPQN
jgi:hypothetical protein